MLTMLLFYKLTNPRSADPERPALGPVHALGDGGDAAVLKAKKGHRSGKGTAPPAAMAHRTT